MEARSGRFFNQIALDYSLSFIISSSNQVRASSFRNEF